MHAQGNDFVIIDGRTQALPALDAALLTAIADRRLGIGCDQLLVLLPDTDCDAAMRIFNRDASEAGNCGNGLRCVGAMLFEENGAETATIRLHDRTVLVEKAPGGIRVHMGKASITDCTKAHVDIDIGNPHRVIFEALGDLPQDRNIEIVSGQIADDVYVDIIERGTGRTPSCGSGACATAVAIWQQDGHQRPQRIHMPGGMVTVSGTPDDLCLEGPVSFVFEGEFRL
jgi:diaminopimelate epimerase